jgi:hypothetical protein
VAHSHTGESASRMVILSHGTPVRCVFFGPFSRLLRACDCPSRTPCDCHVTCSVCVTARHVLRVTACGHRVWAALHVC